MNERELERAIEALVSPRRELDRDGRFIPPPVWYDLPVEAHDRLFAEQQDSRWLEAALDPDGLSLTARAVLARLGLA